MRKPRSNDFDECRDTAEEGYHKNAVEFRLWLRSHYESALNDTACLEAIVTRLYASIIHSDEFDFEPEAVATLFDEAVAAVDTAAAHHCTVHVSELGAVSGLNDRIQFGASDGARKIRWIDHVMLAASDDAHEMIAQRESGA